LFYFVNHWHTPGISGYNRFQLSFAAAGLPRGGTCQAHQGLGVDSYEWDATLALVGEHFRILTWDVRGGQITLNNPQKPLNPARKRDMIGCIEPQGGPVDEQKALPADMAGDGHHLAGV
jgi:hypothetical protein